MGETGRGDRRGLGCFWLALAVLAGAGLSRPAPCALEAFCGQLCIVDGHPVRVAWSAAVIIRTYAVPRSFLKESSLRMLLRIGQVGLSIYPTALSWVKSHFLKALNISLIR